MRLVGLIFRNNDIIWLWVKESSERILMQNSIGVDKYIALNRKEGDILIKFDFTLHHKP